MQPEDFDDEQDEIFPVPKPKPKEKRKVKHLRRGPLPRVRAKGKRTYNSVQKQKRLEADRQYSLVSRPMYLLRLAQKQGRLDQKVSELPGETPRDKLNALPSEEHPRCEFALTETGCKGEKPATTIHHTQGRGKLLNDSSTFLGGCWPCHRYVEKHRKWAKEQGYIIPRNERVTTPEDF